ncbi:YggS family pyridoxal phosphate-dependent enzyme [bacterium]|nr:YggS family pyridoxal phosphate-dependent enzyme [bacterium]
MTNVAANIAGVRERIGRAASRAGRDPNGVLLLAVSKTHPAEAVEAAYAAGQRDFGENYAQEARQKAGAVRHADVRWHFIGHLQTNKVRQIAPFVSVIHTVDSERLAAEIARRARGAGRETDVLLQVNVAGETQKSGCAPDEAEAIARVVADLPGVRLAGLMTMPPLAPPERTRPHFRRLRELRDGIARRLAMPLPDLSMGMSDDLEVAVEEGATIVRVGTAIFGARETA